MRNLTKIPNSLVLINILTLVLIITMAFFPQSALRVILGLPCMLFFPGYVLTLAVFPNKESVRNIEGMALSFGLSIMATILVGLAMKYTPWGISTYSVVFSLSIFIAVVSVIAYYRWRRIPVEDRISLSPQFGLPQWKSLSRLDKTLSVTLILLLVGIIGILCYGYLVVIPRGGEQFTEFYVVTPSGQANNYPSELIVGKEAIVVLGVANHEGQETSYYIDVTIDGIKSGETVPLTLSSGDKREEEVSFIVQKAAQGQKVEFILYKNGGSDPYATLYLFIDAH
jgi:uncharacterized membrane protein